MTSTDLYLLLSSEHQGPESGTSVPALASRLHTNERDVRAGLEALSEGGYPVVTLPRAGGKSVYLARTPDELQVGIDHLEHKRDSTSVRIARLRQTQREWWRKGQLRLAV